MKGIVRHFLIFGLIVFLSFQIQLSSEMKNQTKMDRIQKCVGSDGLPEDLKIAADYGKIPLYFIPNEGQVNEQALFYAKTSRYTLWLTKQGLVFDSVIRRQKKGRERQEIPHQQRIEPKDFTHERDVSRLIFLDAQKNAEIVPVSQTEHRVNYFIGNDKAQWRTNIQTSHEVLYRGLYRNIDLKVYGKESQIEYDFVVNPGGKVADIGFAYWNVDGTGIDEKGNLVIRTAFGELVHSKPVCYQIINGQRLAVESRFKKIADDSYGFDVEEYNRDYALIIDPVLIYSTYLGGPATIEPMVLQ
jgi:hypothetical protein